MSYNLVSDKVIFFVKHFWLLFEAYYLTLTFSLPLSSLSYPASHLAPLFSPSLTSLPLSLILSLLSFSSLSLFRYKQHSLSTVSS